MEWVWGVARPALFEVFETFQGFRPATDSESLADLSSRLEPIGDHRPRPEAEEDPTWKQIIPYVVLTCGDSRLLLERLPRQGEARLHHLFSVGVGGHVGRESGPEGVLFEGLRREVQEEVELESLPVPELLGYLNDDETPVGAVHFGVVCRLEVPEPVEIREKEKMRGRWVGAGELAPYRDRMESWSRFLLDSGVLTGP